ncbi:hypothetical protein ACIBK8_15415 [Streptomyces sp. NPDC050161]|uniref:hypothetical protein n=1 Tax=Streptomyces sp. NPDC050161 TaxID=3365604 RepID=UPI00379B38E3
MTAAHRNHGSCAPARMTRFDDIYTQPDPRPYFRTLGPLGYRTPHYAQGLFRRLAHHIGIPGPTGEGGDRRATVLDVCCSYGINAALLNHHVTWDELHTRYTSPQAARWTTAELIEADLAYYAARRRSDAVPVIGLDIAAPALAYARAAGLLDAAFAENLETAPPTPALRRAAGGVRLITVTGGASFLSARTFHALLDSTERPPWVAAFVLRTGSYGDIAIGLAEHGLVTEKDTARTYPQRRFTDARERQYAIAAVTAAGDDPHGAETGDHFHTALHLSRPAVEAAAEPLHTVLRAP